MPHYGLKRVILTSPCPDLAADTREAYDYHKVVHQSMAYGAFHGGEDSNFIPGVGGNSLLDLLYEDSREQKDRVRYQRYVNRVCGLRCHDRDICISIHGEDRREIQVMNISPDTHDQADMYTIAQHDYGVEEIYSNYSINGEDGEELSCPLIAARCASSIDYFKLQVPLDCSSEPVTLKRIHGASTTGTVNGGILRDFSWNQYVSSHGIVLEDSGMLFETDLSIMDNANYTRSSRKSQHILDTKKNIPSDLSSMGVMRCETCALHPQLAMVVWQDAVLKVDFRKKNSNLLMTSSRGQNSARVLYDFSCDSQIAKRTCVTAFAVASRHADVQHAYAVSTPSHVCLFDLRKPSCPLVTWEHYSKFPSARTTSWYDFKTALPSNLQFVDLDGQEDALLLSNSFHGNAVLLRWKCTDPGKYIEFNKGKISYKKEISEKPRDISEPGVLMKGSLYFSWKPVSFKRLEPIKPPVIVYNHLHPEPEMFELSKWQNQMIFRNQDRIRCGEQDLRQLLPNKNQVCRDLGSCIIQRTWETSEPIKESPLIRLGLFDERIVGSFHSWSDTDNASVSASETSGSLEFSSALLVGQSRQNLSSGEPMIAADDFISEISGVDFESSDYKLAFDNRIRAPLHGAIFHQAQAEYNRSTSCCVDNIDGFTPGEIGLFLIELLEQLAGIPLSAYEAWHILQRCIIEAKDDQRNCIKSIIANISDHAFLFSRPTHMKQKGNKRKDRGNPRDGSNDLADFANLKGFIDAFSTHQDDIIGEKNIGPALSSSGWLPRSSLGPSPLFLQVWDELGSPRERRILSWTLASPEDLADVLYFIGPLQTIESLIAEVGRSKKEQSAVLKRSFVSMKVLVGSSDSHIPVPIINTEIEEAHPMSEEAKNSFRKLQDRWDRNQL